MEAFSSVREPARSTRTDSGTPPAVSPPAPSSEPEAPLTGAALGHRFEALAAQPVSSDQRAAINERFDAALDVLRPYVPSAIRELRPAAGLALLAESEPEAAGRWLLAMLPLLHEAAQMAVLEVRLDRRTTLRAAALGTETRIDLAADRNRRLARVSGSPERLARDAFSARQVRRSRREGTELMRKLARFPLSLGELADSGASAIDPLSFWRLIAALVPAVPTGVGGVIRHSDPARSGFDATVELRPGYPVRLLASSAEADAELSTSGREILEWACSENPEAAGSEWLAGGDADVETLALRTISAGAAAPVSHIRSRS